MGHAWQVKLARIAAREKAKEALDAANSVAYAHGIDPNQYKAEKAKAWASSVSNIAGDAASVFGGKAAPGAAAGGDGGAHGHEDTTKPKSNNNMIMAVVAVFVVIVLFMFGGKR